MREYIVQAAHVLINKKYMSFDIIYDVIFLGEFMHVVPRPTALAGLCEIVKGSGAHKAARWGSFLAVISQNSTFQGLIYGSSIPVTICAHLYKIINYGQLE